MASILVIDDEPGIRDLLHTLFGDLGHNCKTASSLKQGLALAVSDMWDVVFLDVRLPDGSGLDILAEIRGCQGNPEVIIITAFGDKDGAEIAIINGAWDYLQKPPSIDQLQLALDRALQYRKQKQAVINRSMFDRSGIVGQSPALLECLDLLAKAAPSEAPVLITGDTGTGKELFARALHKNSTRANGPFVVVDCASLPENLVESVLFGHAKGAFTGAHKASVGLVGQADNGTLFLDEIGELPVLLQTKLLRVLQEHRYRPVGLHTEHTSDFRLTAATNRDLQLLVDKGHFREDLLYRLKAYHIKLPPLEQRRQDIKDLTMHFLEQLCSRYKIPPKGISQDFFQMMEAYNWPGNVRELSHTLEMVLTLAIDESNLFARHLPKEIRAQGIAANLKPATEQYTKQQESVDKPQPGCLKLPSFKDYRYHAVERVEKEYLELLAARSNGDITQAMQISNLGRTRLYNLLKKHRVSLKDRL
jgi:two-component system NtrC family response regulator